VNTINNQCFCPSPNDPKISYLFDMNETKQKHKELTFFQSEGDVFGSKHIIMNQKGHSIN